jgi:hypothetical protein
VIFFSKKTRLSESKVSIVLTIVGVVLLLIPLVALSTGIYTSGTELFLGYQDGTIAIPKPKLSMQEWPIIGNEAYSFMSLASSNLESLLFKYSGEVKVVPVKPPLLLVLLVVDLFSLLFLPLLAVSLWRMQLNANVPLFWFQID